MVFSGIFGKKEQNDKAKDKGRSTSTTSAPDSKKSSSLPSRPTVTPATPKNDAAHRELARATAKKIDQIESEMSLDFMPPKPLPAKAGSKPAAPPPPPPKAPAVAPVKAAGGRTLTGKPAAPKVAPAKVESRKINPHTLTRASEQHQAPHTLPPLDASSSIILGDTLGAMALEISSSASAPIIEEVAILYANGQGVSAINALVAAIKEDQLGPSTGQAWMMLFDLYQLLNKKTEFENLALDFVGRFESSPPAWDNGEDSTAPAAKPAAVNTGTPGVVAFAATLGEDVSETIEQIKKAGVRSNQIKVDFSAVQKIEAAGCALLLKFFPTLKKSGHVLSVTGVEHLVSVLLGMLETGRRDPSDAPWMLLLEMYRVLGKQAEFEEKSIDYCVTFEVSPPSWEGLPTHLKLSQEKIVAPAPTTAKAAESPRPPGEEFKLTGELLGKAEMDLSKLSAYGADRALIAVNCKALRRIDFAAGGTLLNMLVGLTSAGKKIEFNQVNHLVAALFVVMGIHELALINIKRG